MNNENLSKEYRFSSTNQPPPESKRVPKIKTLIKKTIRENFDVFKDKIKDGNDRFWKIGMDEISEKVNKHKVNASITNKLDDKDKESIKKELIDILKKEINV